MERREPAPQQEPMTPKKPGSTVRQISLPQLSSTMRRSCETIFTTGKPGRGLRSKQRRFFWLKHRLAGYRVESMSRFFFLASAKSSGSLNAQRAGQNRAKAQALVSLDFTGSMPLWPPRSGRSRATGAPAMVKGAVS